jgi:hypothetical protein
VTAEVIDLLKVMLVCALLMAAGAIVLFGGAHLATNAGLSIDWIAAFGGIEPRAAVPLLSDVRMWVLVGSVFLAAAGLALLVTSATLDMGISLLSKAIAVLSAAQLGIVGGVWVYLRFAHGIAIGIEGLNRLAIVLVLAVLFSSALSNASLRRLGWGRLAAGIGMIVAAPLILVSV